MIICYIKLSYWQDTYKFETGASEAMSLTINYYSQKRLRQKLQKLSSWCCKKLDPKKDICHCFIGISPCISYFKIHSGKKTFFIASIMHFIDVKGQFDNVWTKLSSLSPFTMEILYYIHCVQNICIRQYFQFPHSFKV